MLGCADRIGRTRETAPVAAGASKEHPMPQRVPVSMRTRQSLSDLIEGRLSSLEGRAELVKLAVRGRLEEGADAAARTGEEARRGADYADCEHGLVLKFEWIALMEIVDLSLG
jgi:hypothetical protein